MTVHTPPPEGGRIVDEPMSEALSRRYLAYALSTITNRALPDVWPAIFVRFEAGLLEDLGFGLDLSRCAVTGSMDDLVWVSPRTGRAVSREAGGPYADKLLNLPPFMLGAQAGLGQGDVGAGLALTGHFLEQFVFHPQNRPIPPARLWMIDKLREQGRL